MELNDKKLAVAIAIEEFEREKATGHIIIHFKHGQLMAGEKNLGFIK